MQTLVVSRSPNFKVVAVAALLVVLGALAGYALLKETRRAAPVEAPPTSAFSDAPRKAFSAEEERFAQALIAVHEQVKSSAVAMMFAGITYKTGGMSRSGFVARIKPAAVSFANAQAQFGKIPVPDSMNALRTEYAEALRLYRSAAEETLKVGGDADDNHLLIAHEMSQRASDLLLKVGEQLWPGEYKPN